MTGLATSVHSESARIAPETKNTFFLLRIILTTHTHTQTHKKVFNMTMISDRYFKENKL
jgi:hypothetical protein